MATLQDIVFLDDAPFSFQVASTLTAIALEFGYPYSLFL